jgi:hypothetical protein
MKRCSPHSPTAVHPYRSWSSTLSHRIFQRLVSSIIGELDFIERRHATILTKTGEFQVNSAKLRIIAALLRLRDEAKVSFEMPRSITEEAFFTEEAANSEPSKYESPDPWMRLREYAGFKGKGPIILHEAEGDV